MPFVPLIELGALVFTFVNFVKRLRVKDWSAVLTQVVAWVAGVVAIVIAAHSDYADSIRFADHTLDKVNGWSQLFLGLIAASLFGAVTEIKKAIDASDSAATPKLLK